MFTTLIVRNARKYGLLRRCSRATAAPPRVSAIISFPRPRLRAARNPKSPLKLSSTSSSPDPFRFITSVTVCNAWSTRRIFDVCTCTLTYTSTFPCANTKSLKPWLVSTPPLFLCSVSPYFGV
ncbi:unnamed protein product [Chondrus crispus]|uniref:Uncharacterized protein n=1 Tax=Chondrus crispus TaxID=2769 RepID=R7Q4U5_CHOCR|nr:unnamed protein product [Chondrus crispus]CDF33024.1 unnamed protein product [Chondrus crispus]|eukprot:XP_005712827.1 unnamed protein product [Chondrus crispus]